MPRSHHGGRHELGQNFLIHDPSIEEVLSGAGVTVATVVLVFGVFFLLASVQRADAAGMCLSDTGDLPADVEGWQGEQLTNAAAIVKAGIDLGVDREGQVLAVMTAMGESSLRNITYGDWETSGVTNPDGSRTTSIGLFQQQDSWER